MAASAAAARGRIFISYRREETAYPAGWLFDRLAEHFGDGQVFKDVDSIELGDDFVEVIHNAVGSCDVLLALIGEHWMTITDEHGQRRLDNPDDFVRLEIEAALKRKIRVIPILVEGATMPRADELPSSLATLVRRQALELSPTRFSSDTSRLLKVLDRFLAEVQAQQTAGPLSSAPARPASGSTGIPNPEAAPEELEDAEPGVEHHATPGARDDGRLPVAGQLAIVGAALLVAGLFPNYEWTDSLWVGRGDRADMRWYALYALMLAAVTLVAGICTLIPRTRRLTGPALLLGIAAASIWGVLFLISDRLRYGGGTTFGGGWWFQLVAHLALVLAACLAALALARTTEVRLTRRPPRGELAWLVALFGAAGALALLFNDRNLWHTSWLPDRWYVVPSIWMTAVALVVPACAGVVVPRRLGIALLAGWIGGASALFSFNYLWDRYQESGTGDTNPIIVFGFTLLALVVMAVLFARAAPSSQVERAAPD
jgi:TIR domain